MPLPTPSQLLKTAQVSQFLVTNLVNIRYLTGLELSAGVLLVTPRKYTLFVDGRYLEVAQRTAYKSVQVKKMSALKAALAQKDQVGFEAETVTVAELKRWQKTIKNTKFVQRNHVLDQFRRSKTPAEIRQFRRAQTITRRLLKNVPKLLKPGVTEQTLAWQLEAGARAAGAQGLAFEPIVAFGTHSSQPHHHPSKRKLKRGMIVQIDVGAQVNGYCADQSAVFFTTQPTKKQQFIYEVVAQAKAAAKSLVAPGVTTHQLDSAAREVLKQYDLEQYFTHSLGHGVGLEIHEGVSLSSQGEAVALLKNEIITIEPGVYLPGQFGIRLEEEVVV